MSTNVPQKEQTTPGFISNRHFKAWMMCFLYLHRDPNVKKGKLQQRGDTLSIFSLHHSDYIS
jgi:hypothetical protein